VVALAGCYDPHVEALDAFGVPDAPDPDATPSTDAPATPDGALACPYDYLLVGPSGSRFRVGQAVFWPDAEADCEDDSNGLTHLAVPDDQAENDFIRVNTPDEKLWIGVSRRINDDVFLTVTGDPLGAFAPWSDGQPSSDGDCTIIWRSDQSGKWYAEPCDGPYTQLTVCECDGLPPDPDSF
jgi:hypothetical protein